MNNFFKKGALIAVFTITGIFVLAELGSYLRLALLPASKYRNETTIPERGSIVDKNGKPLAIQTNFYNVGISPKNIKLDKRQKFAQDICEPLELSAQEILKKIQDEPDSNYILLRRKLSQENYTRLKEITDDNQYSSFVKYDKIPGRIYPEKSLASQLIGYMGSDGIGLSGTEYTMQNELQPVSEGDFVQGKNVYLTIDANLQYKLEKLANQAKKDTDCESLMLLAADAKNGELLSYISLPSTDLNNYTSAEVSETVDRPALDAFEPGSVFKIFTVATIYDHGYLRSDETFFCDGVYTKKTKGETIRIKCLERHGKLTAREALKYSCNDVIAQISEKIGDEQFIQDLRNLGFGQKIGIQLPGEASGFLKEAGGSRWSGRSKATIAMGQEISVTALQMVQAATALSNKGIPLKLSVIKRITNKDGTIEYEHKAEPKDRIFKKSTADYLLSCMETTATAGTGSRANIKDITIGVKTGTAQMADSKKGGYSNTDFLSNCMAIFPIEDPQIILYIVIQKAKGEYLAGRIVAPLIKDCAEEIIDHLGLSRDEAASFEHNGKIQIKAPTPVKLGKTLPDFTGLTKRELSSLLENKNLQVNINGYGWVKSQNPPPGTPITENMTIELNLE